MDVLIKSTENAAKRKSFFIEIFFLCL